MRAKSAEQRAEGVPLADLLARVPEKAFMAQVTALAKLCGWRVYHTHSSMHSAKGFPDLVLVKGGRLVFAELKTMTGKVSAEQEAWLSDLNMVGDVEAQVWRPGDWDALAAVLE